MNSKGILCILLFVFVSYAYKPVTLISGSDSVRYVCSTISNDGKTIALTMVMKKGMAIGIADSNCLNLKTIVTLENLGEAHWSKNDSSIIFVGCAKRGNLVLNNVWSINVDGTGLKQLTKPPPPKSDFGDESPCFSTNGRQIIWTHNRRLWIMDLNGTNAKPLSATPAKFNEYAICWSNDNKRLFYIATETANNYLMADMPPQIPEVRSISAEGKDQRLVQKMPPAAHVIKLSPNGNDIYCGLENVLVKLSLKDSSVHDTIYSYSPDNFYDISPVHRWLIVCESPNDGQNSIKKVELPFKTGDKTNQK